jgi:hypothetical protein
MSVGRTTSDPCTMKKGVKPVARHSVVRGFHSTDDISATHLAQNFSRHLNMRGFNPCRLMPFTLLT